MRITIRFEQPNDVQRIHEVTTSAFLDAPHTDHTEQFIVRQLRDSNALSLSLVAEADNQILGHVAVSPVEISDGSNDWYGLGPISVLPAYQHKGIGSQLMNSAIQELKAMGAKGCVLLGDPNYYQCFGFEAKKGLVLAYVPEEYFQALVFSGDVPQGEVRYHQAFLAKG